MRRNGRDRIVPTSVSTLVERYQLVLSTDAPCLARKIWSVPRPRAQCGGSPGVLLPRVASGEVARVVHRRIAARTRASYNGFHKGVAGTGPQAPVRLATSSRPLVWSAAVVPTACRRTAHAGKPRSACAPSRHARRLELASTTVTCVACTGVASSNDTDHADRSRRGTRASRAFRPS
jgi:hypothetical protein